MGLARLTEDVRGGDLALILADVGQLPDAGDIADRPQPLARPLSPAGRPKSLLDALILRLSLPRLWREAVRSRPLSEIA
jgi:hypothetical protein